MKYCALFLLSLFTCRGWTQKPATAVVSPSDSLGQAVIKAKCDTRHITLPWRRRAPDNPTLFRGIRVLDCRRDTSRIGVVHSGMDLQAQILLHNGSVSNAFTALLDSVYASPKGADSLLVVIKDLWISDSIDRGVGPRGLFSDPYWCRLAFRFEAYLQQDGGGGRDLQRGGFVPLVYLDTVAETKGSEEASVTERRLLELSNVFMEKVAAMDVPGTLAKRRTVSMLQIDSFSNRRFAYAMDTVTRPVSGVYADVDEFRNNRPSITDYKITKDKQGNRELRVRDADGQYYYSHTLWGFSDGWQTYVMMDGNLFPIFRVQHQFYVLGSNQYKQDVVAIIPFMLPLGPAAMVYGATTVNSGIYRKLQVFRLDANTGAVFK